MTSTAEIEVGDIIEVTELSNTWFGMEAEVITISRNHLGVRVKDFESAMPAVGVHINRKHAKKKEAPGG